MTYVPDPGDVEVARAALALQLSPEFEIDARSYRTAAAFVVASLAAAGRLLPPNGSERVEWGERVGGAVLLSSKRPSSRSTHRRTITSWHVEGEVNDNWPRYLGPWVAVDEGGAK